MEWLLLTRLSGGVEDQDISDIVYTALYGGPVGSRGLVGPLNGLSLPVCPKYEVMVQGQTHGLGDLVGNHTYHVLSWKHRKNVKFTIIYTA